MATATAERSIQLPGAQGQDRRASESWIRRLPLMPALLFTIVVTQIPFLLTVYYSLQSWNIAKPGSPHWVGLRNYIDVFSDPVFYGALLHTHRDHLRLGADRDAPRARPGGAAGPQVLRPRPSPHAVDLAVSDHAHRGRAAVEDNDVRPGLRHRQLGDRVVWHRPGRLCQHPSDGLGDHHRGVAVDSVRDADPARRPAGPAADVLEAARVDGASAGRASARSPCPTCAPTSSSACCSARSTSSTPSTRST